MIYATDGWNYVQLPKENFCCKCTDKWGMLRYDWLQDAQFLGYDSINGVRVQHWGKQGDPRNAYGINNYYATDPDQLLLKFFESRNNNTGKYFFKELDYDLTTYRKGTPDPSIFSPPSNCETRCPGLPCHRVFDNSQ